MDIKLIFLTGLAIISRKKSLKFINNILRGKAVDQRLIIIAMRNSPLIPYPPPGSDQIVVSRDL